MSLKPIISAVNVVLTTDGLFLTLGKIMPPLRDGGLLVDELLLAVGNIDCGILAMVVGAVIAATITGVVGVVDVLVPAVDAVDTVVVL